MARLGEKAALLDLRLMDGGHRIPESVVVPHGKAIVRHRRAAVSVVQQVVPVFRPVYRSPPGSTNRSRFSGGGSRGRHSLRSGQVA